MHYFDIFNPHNLNRAVFVVDAVAKSTSICGCEFLCGCSAAVQSITRTHATYMYVCYDETDRMKPILEILYNLLQRNTPSLIDSIFKILRQVASWQHSPIFFHIRNSIKLVILPLFFRQPQSTVWWYAGSYTQ